jgi:hypothetical protein
MHQTILYINRLVIIDIIYYSLRGEEDESPQHTGFNKFTWYSFVVANLPEMIQLIISDDHDKYIIISLEVPKQCVVVSDIINYVGNSVRK